MGPRRQGPAVGQAAVQAALLLLPYHLEDLTELEVPMVERDGV